MSRSVVLVREYDLEQFSLQCGNVPSVRSRLSKPRKQDLRGRIPYAARRLDDARHGDIVAPRKNHIQPMIRFVVALHIRVGLKSDLLSSRGNREGETGHPLAADGDIIFAPRARWTPLDWRRERESF